MFQTTSKDKVIQRLEKDNKKPIMKFLKTLKPDGFFFNIPQGARSLVGISDILGIYNGHFLAFEAKGKDKKATPMQKVFLKLVTKAGGTCGVVWCVYDVKILFQLYQYKNETREFQRSSYALRRNMRVIDRSLKFAQLQADVYSQFLKPKELLPFMKIWNEKTRSNLTEKELEQTL